MVHVTDVSKRFRSGRGSVRALLGISFGLAQGRSLALVGKSGSGKTTLLNCIGGLEQPDSGRIQCLGQELLGLGARELALFQRRQLGFVFQFGNLLSYLTVSENIALPLVLNGASRRQREQRVAELLEQIGMTAAGRALPKELAGGETQRVALARAVAHRPGLLLADEPTANLDSDNARQLIGLLTELSRKQQTTVIIATHDSDLVALMDAVLVLKDGQVAKEG